jgi:hypothetical protein
MKLFISFLLISTLTILTPSNCAADFEIEDTLSGLAWGEFEIISDSSLQKSLIYVLRLNPDYYEFRLLSSAEDKCSPMSVKDWCVKYDYEIGFNAGMYAEDNKTTVGYCKNFDFMINNHFNKHNSVFAFNSKNIDSAAAIILDRQCDDFDILQKEYHSLLQSIRMIGCTGENVWKQSPKTHSILSLAGDSSGHILLIFSRTPLSVHDFIEHVLTLDLKIIRMMYLEGSTPACLYVNNKNVNVSLGGVINELVPLMIQPTEVNLPNIIAVKRKLKGK